MAKRYNPHYETIFLTRKIHLCVWADCNASGALVYAYLREWIEYNKAHIKKAQHQGRFWVYRTIDEIHEGLGRVLSPRAIANALKSLKEHHYIITGDFNKVRSNRTIYYALERDPDQRCEDGSSPESNAVLDLKEQMEEKKAENAARKAASFDIDEFIEEVIHHKDYTGTAAETIFSDAYKRRFCFAWLDEHQKEEVLRNYIESVLKQGNVPSFNNFVSEGMQQTLANRFAGKIRYILLSDLPPENSGPRW